MVYTDDKSAVEFENMRTHTLFHNTKLYIYFLNYFPQEKKVRLMKSP
jgi:hypothetical protein